MFSEKTVKLLTDLPLAIINSANATPVDESLLQPKVLLKLSKDGNVCEVKKLFIASITYRTKQYLETFDEVGQTPLILASRYGHYDLMVLLIESGAFINAYDYDNWTPLLNAAKEGHVEIVKYLVQHGAGIENVDSGSFTPLMWACYKNHVEVVRVLLEHGANPNAKCRNSICCLSWAAGRDYEDVVYELLKSKFIKVDNVDKNGTTPLIWAARKGCLEIVKALIQYNANPDAIGMNNWTPLIISCKNGNIETALYLLTLDEINVNHIDKDGNSALSISAKSGYTAAVVALLEKGAYVNVPNKKGDSILITAVKNGHKDVVSALLTRHVEINTTGTQGKTALHFAIERSSLEMVKMLLAVKVDAEIPDEEGQTPLLLASRKKNANIVNELLNYGCKLSVTDHDGDNALHIALRSRNRDITELLLSNPKNSKYLYKPNKRGETPYKVDANNPKSIITQIFGAKHLNMTEDSILGYDLYSSALAEILSEPSLNTPITVGLYAKWGSGKSFLLSQLKDEMKSFAKLTKMITLKINIFTVLTVVLLSFVVAYPLLLWKWYIGLTFYSVLVASTFITLAICKYNHNHERNEWSTVACERISKGLTKIKLLLQVLFLNPTTHKKESLEHRNLRFIFTDYGKISTIGGERALAQMVITLYKRIEDEYGFLVIRLCRVFQHKSHTKSVPNTRRFRNVCCVPTFVLIIIFLIACIGLSILIRVKGFNVVNFQIQENILLCTFLLIILLSLVASSITCFKILINFFKSPRICIMRSLSKIQNGNKIEGFLLELKHEIEYMAETVLTLDTFTHSKTRLVVIIDGLDSCEQNKVLQILEIVHVLFTKEGDPYITILAVDPHVLIKGIEGNLMVDFCNKNGSLNGHEYLRTIIHLPIYLQINLSKAKALSKIAKENEDSLFPRKRTNTMSGSTQDVYSSKSIGDAISNAVDNKKNKKAKRERSATKVKPMSAFDLTAQLMKNDYFLDVNPRNLRRLINIIALTGRLLRAYHIDFNWNVLASWIYLVEQWPYRCSWIVMWYEETEGEFTDATTLKEIYSQIRNKLQSTNTTALMALDRNGRKFELLLENCTPPLTVLTLKKFLPCTCNLDPYLIKLIQESIDDRNLTIDTMSQNANTQRNLLTIQAPSRLVDPNEMTMHSFTSQSQASDQLLQFLTPITTTTYQTPDSVNSMKDILPDAADLASYSQIDMQRSLNQMNADDVVDSLHSIDGLNGQFIEIYSQVIQEKNINGRVLACCDLDELKSEMNMTFGDWQLFKSWLKQQRYLQVVKLNKEKMQQSGNKQTRLTNKILNNNLNNSLNNQPKPAIPAVFSHLFGNHTNAAASTSEASSNTLINRGGQGYFDASDSKCPLIETENTVSNRRKSSTRDFNDPKKVDFFINQSDNSPDSNQTTISSIETATINFLFDSVKHQDDRNDENGSRPASVTVRNDSSGDIAETTALLEPENRNNESSHFSHHESIVKRKHGLNKSIDNLFGEKQNKYTELKSEDSSATLSKDAN